MIQTSPKSSLFKQSPSNRSAAVGNLLDDIEFNSSKMKDFRQAYKVLAKKLIKKGQLNESQKLKSNLLITEKSIQDYLSQKQSAGPSE